MTSSTGKPEAAAVSIGDLLDCARIQPGQDVLLIAHLDGLSDGANLVDREAIEWIRNAVKQRGANASILWIEEPDRPHRWRLPPVVKSAIKAADVSILHSFDITFEEIVELKQFIYQEKIRLIRNFATTAPLLCTTWAQTPNELVSAIRFQTGLSITVGAEWQLSDPNGTHLEGKINPVYDANHPWFTRYAISRDAGGGYIPWPEWVTVPIRLADTSGVFIFDRMLSWWSRYIGISPYFNRPISLNIANGRITGISGGEEAEALKKFLNFMEERLGDGVYDFNCLHFGVHPRAEVSPQECPNMLYRRLIEHCHSSNLHVHVGAPSPTKDYPYWMHCTGDIRRPTFKVGDTLVYDRGHLSALDDPVVKAVAAKYPGRPGI